MQKGKQYNNHKQQLNTELKFKVLLFVCKLFWCFKPIEMIVHIGLTLQLVL